MLKNKKSGFTLAEILLALVIVGIIAGLVLPSLLKDMQSKSRMGILKSTLVGIDDVIHREIAEKRTEDIANLDIYRDPQEFLKKFNDAVVGTPFADTYKNYNGTIVPNVGNLTKNELNGKILLKNGVGIGIRNPKAGEAHRYTLIVIDVTGEAPPNTVGIDLFTAQLIWDEDLNNGIHVGDVHGLPNGGANGTESEAGLKTACLAGNPASCFRLAELTGYDNEFLENNY